MFNELTHNEAEGSSANQKEELPRARSLGGLALLVFGGLSAVLFGYGWTILAIVAILTLVLLHELGHFATAKCPSS